MEFFKRLIDVLTLGSDRPVRRLVAYYIVLGGLMAALMNFFPVVDQVVGGKTVDVAVSGSNVLEDGMGTEPIRVFDTDLSPRLELALSTTIILLGTLLLMLPVSWVYMSTRSGKSHNQSVAQTLVILPMVVAGIILIVQNSLALAFSLAGVVAAVRFRTTLRDARDVVFIFLAIAVGFAAGVQALIIAALVSLIFNFVLILTWRYDFGRNVLEPTASSVWSDPLHELAERRGAAKVPDRDLVLALDHKKATALAERFDRVRKMIGPHGKKPRFNAILTVTTDQLAEAQTLVGEALDEIAGRWRLDEVVTNVGKPSQLYYLLRVRKSTSKDELITAVRAKASATIGGAEVELAEVKQEEEEKQ
ncbi:MAG TPA: DUF4956 domain-containing protein [Gemmatimonadales bacterium]